MRVSKRCVDLIRQFEGLRLSPYLCQSGVPTIGYGHTAGVTMKTQPITEADAADFLAGDLDKYERGVTAAVKVPLTQNEFDALVSLAFNIGIGEFRTSTLLRHLNAGDKASASDQFQFWNKRRKSGVLVVSPGLVARRLSERKLFESR